MKQLLWIFLVVLMVGCQTETKADGVTETQTSEILEEGRGHHEVIVKNSLLPETVHISRGETVTWVKAEEADHRIVGDSFDSGQQLVEGSTYSVTFSEAGTYEYRDTYTGHQGMIVSQ
ncbi:MAG: cupredoxin domain-containing protein [Nanobdellota archaeon]